MKTEELKEQLSTIVQSMHIGVDNQMMRPSGIIRKASSEDMHQAPEETRFISSMAAFAMLRQKLYDQDHSYGLQLLFLSGYCYESTGKLTEIMQDTSRNFDEKGFQDLSGDQCVTIREALSDELAKHFTIEGMSMRNLRFQFTICWSIGRRMRKMQSDMEILNETFAREWVGDDEPPTE